jgi:hypothetical protein
VEDHCSRVALAPSRSDATVGSALDCDLARREDARHGGRATPGFRTRGAECCVTAGHHRPGGSGDGRPASAARPAGPPPERARHWSTPGARTVPRLSPPRPSAWWCSPSQFTLSLSITSRLLRCARAEVRRSACRRRALEAVEKVVALTTRLSDHEKNRREFSLSIGVRPSP